MENTVKTFYPQSARRAHAPTWRAILWGLEQGLTPDADLFELFIQALALMPRRHAWAMQILKYDMRVRALQGAAALGQEVSPVFLPGC